LFATYLIVDGHRWYCNGEEHSEQREPIHRDGETVAQGLLGSSIFGGAQLHSGLEHSFLSLTTDYPAEVLVNVFFESIHKTDVSLDADTKIISSESVHFNFIESNKCLDSQGFVWGQGELSVNEDYACIFRYPKRQFAVFKSQGVTSRVYELEGNIQPRFVRVLSTFPTLHFNRLVHHGFLNLGLPTKDRKLSFENIGLTQSKENTQQSNDDPPPFGKCVIIFFLLSGSGFYIACGLRLHLDDKRRTLSTFLEVVGILLELAGGIILLGSAIPETWGWYWWM
jgi:hypothetical protein